MAKSKIEWTDDSWNPVTGCDKISRGCDFCYAERVAKRLQRIPNSGYEETGFNLTLRPERLSEPFGWKKPRKTFVVSMGDLFHKEIPDEYIARVFDTMEQANRHTYQVLTKRSSIMQKFVNDRYRTTPAPAHIWLGVSVEDQQATSRIAHLQGTNATTRFLSLEPLLGPLDKLDLRDIDWVICGGESREKGQRGRFMDPDWARSIRDQCADAGVAFFMKQMTDKKPIPADLLVRQYPVQEPASPIAATAPSAVGQRELFA